MTQQEQYWKNRCEAAEELIRSSPDERDKLYDKWLESRTEPPAPVCPSQTHNFHIARHGKCQDCGGTEWMDAPAPAQGVEGNAEPCLIQSAFLLENGKRIIVGSSCWTGISSFECDENWNRFKEPFATAPLSSVQGALSDYHRKIRSIHGQDKLVKEHSTYLGEEIVTGSRWQQGQQGNVNPGFDIWTKEALNLLHWSSLGADVLSTMCKKVNLTAGAEKAKELSENIKSFLANPSKSPRVPAATEPTPPNQPAPTIGARWVRASERRPKEGWYNAKYNSNVCVMHVDNGNLILTFPYGLIVTKPYVNQLEYLDKSPATFPTREQAEQWGDFKYKCSPSGWQKVKAALDMYDWIVQQLKQKI